MEGVGSRLGRASSRYGPSTTASVFNGPVRKWKKKWVHVSPSSSTATQQHNSHSHSNGHSNNNNNDGNSRLLLCRWTPLSRADAAYEGPPKRKFRYTPVVVLEEEQKKAVQQVDDEANHEAKADGTNQYTAMQTSKNNEPSSDTALKTETQDANMSNLDLGLCLKGHNEEDPGSVGQTNESRVNKASSGGFWMAG